MPNNYFQFKQFTIHQEGTAMKVETDGVLLGAWVKISNDKTILDIGTGTGLIALMLAQRSSAIIHAIEIDNSAAKQALENFQNSSWNGRLTLIHQSFQEYSNKNIKYDLLVSNPPYFSESLKAPDEQRSTARHDHSLNRIGLLKGVMRLMDRKGRFAIILPVNEYKSFFDQAAGMGFFEIRKTRVISKPGKKAERIMAELSIQKHVLAENELIVEQYGRHGYSEDYIALTKDFYLKF